MKDKFRKIKNWFPVCVLGFLFFPGVILAATNIDTDLPTVPLITENNILPGDTFSRTVTITKLSDGGRSETLLIRFDAQEAESQAYDLSKKMLVSIKRVYDGKLMILPNGKTQQSLEELYDIYADPNDPNNNNGAFVFDTIYGIANSTFEYQILFTFDPATEDRNFQGQATNFDLSMGIYSSNTQAQADDGGGGGGHNRHHHKGNGSNASGSSGLINALFNQAGLVTGAANGDNQPEVKGESTPPEGTTEGVSVAACHGWPKWVWILALVIFTLNFWRNIRKNYKAGKVKWIFPLVWTIVAVVFWYFFDKCREYQWFLYGSIIIAIISYFIYLWRLKKKIRNRDLPIDPEID